MVNLTDVAETFGQFFGVGEATGGVIIAVLVVLAFLLALSIYSQNQIAIAVASISLFAVFTYIGWIDIWITILIALGIAVLVGKSTGRILSGNGGEM